MALALSQSDSSPSSAAFWRKSFALVKRNFRATLVDKGRIADLIIFPISFLVIWGLFFSAGIIEEDAALTLLMVNLVWSISSSYQMQSDFILMYDIWSGELVEILRSGINQHHLLVAMIALGTIIGTFNLIVFFLAIQFIFGVPFQDGLILFTTLPAYYIASMALALLVAGGILRLGKSYAFLTWTMLQIIIMFSSPFTPVAVLPDWLQALAWLSPYTHIFEYIRFGNAATLNLALIQGLCYTVVGYWTYTKMFAASRKSGKLSTFTFG